MLINVTTQIPEHNKDPRAVLLSCKVRNIFDIFCKLLVSSFQLYIICSAHNFICKTREHLKLIILKWNSFM